MVKITFCLRRLPSLSYAQFDVYWHETHGPLVAKHADVLGIRRYVQLTPAADGIAAIIATVRDAPDSGFDGIAELWFDGLEAMKSGFETPEGRAAGKELLDDERRFIDLSRSPIILSEERVIVG